MHNNYMFYIVFNILFSINTHYFYSLNYVMLRNSWVSEPSKKHLKNSLQSYEINKMEEKWGHCVIKMLVLNLTLFLVVRLILNWLSGFNIY